MKAATGLRIWLISAMLLLPLAHLAAQSDDTAARPAIAALDKDAARLRGLADAARRDAADLDELAKAAREAAAKTTDPVVRAGWEKGADEHAARAQARKAEAARLTAQADEKAAQARKLEATLALKPATAGPPETPPVAGGGSLKPSGADPVGRPTAAPTGGGEAPRPSPTGADAACTSDQASSNEPVPMEAIIGQWVSDDGETVEISPQAPNDNTRFILKGEYKWDGIYSEGKLTFERTPMAREMSPKAPYWARQEVEGQLKWSLELQLPHKCDEFVLKGPWYPGELKYVKQTALDGTTVKREAKLIGKGKPIDETYRRIQIPRYFLFARTSAGRQYIEELYLGVATEIELQFEKPYDKPDYRIELSVGDQKITLTATRIDPKGYIFRTDAFVPGVAGLDKSDVFDPAPPPRRSP